jgi:hypothetical protein
MLKFTGSPLQMLSGFEVIVPGVFGLPLMVMVRGALLPGVQRVVLATTLTNPLVNEEETFTRIAVVPCPLVIVVPEGVVQV